MAQFVVRNIEKDVKVRLQRRAAVSERMQVTVDKVQLQAAPGGRVGGLLGRSVAVRGAVDAGDDGQVGGRHASTLGRSADPQGRITLIPRSGRGFRCSQRGTRLEHPTRRPPGTTATATGAAGDSGGQRGKVTGCGSL